MRPRRAASTAAGDQRSVRPVGAELAPDLAGGGDVDVAEAALAVAEAALAVADDGSDVDIANARTGAGSRSAPTSVPPERCTCHVWPGEPKRRLSFRSSVSLIAAPCSVQGTKAWAPLRFTTTIPVVATTNWTVSATAQDGSGLRSTVPDNGTA